MYKRFKVKEDIKTTVTADLSGSLKKLLAKRGIDSDELLNLFVNGDSISIRPSIFPDIDKAVSRTYKAIEEGERIGIFGDYDADGISATAILYRYLIEIGADVVVKIPGRDEGYGMTKKGVDELKSAGVNLIITVDNGIVAFDEVIYAKECGIDVIITDHHKPRENLPEAVAVLNPQCTDHYFKEYSGGFVALLFAAALEGDFETVFSQYGYLAAITTIADVMPIVDDNRIIVKKGLEQLIQEDIPSIDAILLKYNINKEDINSDTIAFKIAPTINSAGRVGDPIDAFVLLATDDEVEAEEYAEILINCNLKRREIETNAVALIEEADDMADFGENCIIIYDEDLPEGIIGIIAARFIERYNKTAIVITEGEGVLKGSVRALENFGILECLTAAKDLLDRFGGHSAAAGFSLPKENLDRFREVVLSHKPILKTDVFRSIEVDAIAGREELSISFANDLRILEPYGRENMQPLFLIEKAEIKEINPLSAGKYIKLKLKVADAVFDAVSFDYTIENFPYPKDTTINLIVAISINRYNDREYLSVRIADISQEKPNEDDLSALEAVREGLSFDYPIITREDFAAVYRFLSTKTSHAYDIYDISVATFNCPRLFTTYSAIEIFIEAKLAVLKQVGSKERVEILKSGKKVSLESTAFYKKLYEREAIY